MRRFPILLLGVLSCFVSSKTYGQESVEVRAYYSSICEAETAVLDSNFQKASLLYDLAFRNKFPNDKDLYNAFVVSYFTADTLRAKNYIEKLAYLGVTREQLPDTNSRTDFYRFIASGFDSCYNAGRKSETCKRGEMLKAIFKRDKIVRHELIQAPALAKSADYQMQVRESDAITFSALAYYIRTYGFPSFENKGFWDGSSPNNPSVLFWILYHQRPEETVLDSLVYKAVLRGDFRPDEWATVVAYRTTEKKYNYCMRFWQPLSRVVSDLQAVEASRKTIFLDPLEVYKRKWTAARLEQQQRTERFSNGVRNKKEDLYDNMFLLNFFLLPTDEEIKLGL